MSNTPVPGDGEHDALLERELLDRARNGDEEALERVLAMHQDMVYRTSLRLMAGNEDEAAELAQQVLISAFRKIDRFRGDARFSTWLYRITVNLAKNRYVVQNRERGRYTALDAPVGEGEDAKPRDWADTAVSAHQLAADRETVEILQQRMEQLDPDFREVIVLRFFEELSYEEIAESLGVPVGTVKSRINRARKSLRELMADVMEGDAT